MLRTLYQGSRLRKLIGSLMLAGLLITLLTSAGLASFSGAMAPKAPGLGTLLAGTRPSAPGAQYGIPPRGLPPSSGGKADAATERADGLADVPWNPDPQAAAPVSLRRMRFVGVAPHATI